MPTSALEAIIRDPKANVWDRLPGESLKAFEAFRIYRDMGTGRSHVRVGQELGKSTDLISRWSARWQGVARGENDAGEEDRIAQERRIEDARAALRRHHAVGADLTARAYQAIRKIYEEDAVRPAGQASKLAMSDHLRALGLGVEMVRDALGIPELVAIRAEVGVSADPLEWLRALLRNPETRDLAKQLSHRPNATGDPIAGRPGDGRSRRMVAPGATPPTAARRLSRPSVRLAHAAPRAHAVPGWQLGTH